LNGKVAAPGLENRDNGRGDPLRWPRDTLCPQKLALTSPTWGGRSVGIVRLRTKEKSFSLLGQEATTSNISFLHFLPFPYIQKCIFSKIPPTLPFFFRVDYEKKTCAKIITNDKPACYSETSVTIYQTLQCYIPMMVISIVTAVIT
jgi:hypothetical protein